MHKKTKKSRTRKRDFPPLKNGIAQKQLEALNDASKLFLHSIEETTIVPIGYMRHVFSKLTADVRSNLKARRIDPIERKRVRLQAKIVKFQEELNAISVREKLVW